MVFSILAKRCRERKQQIALIFSDLSIVFCPLWFTVGYNEEFVSAKPFFSLNLPVIFKPFRRRDLGHAIVGLLKPE